MEENIKLKGGKEFVARKCKIELVDGSVIWAKEVKYSLFHPSAGDYLPEEVYYCVPCGKRYSERISRSDIKKMSIIK